jgi:hypothetical protein
MDKLKFQKAIAQLYVDVDFIKQELQEQINIKKFEEKILNSLNSIDSKESVFFKEESSDFLNKVKNKKIELLSKYVVKDIDKTLEDHAIKYFSLTKEYLKTNPDFYDAVVSLTPVWEDDFDRMDIYISKLKINHPHIKIIKKEIYANKGTSASYGQFEIATDMTTAFEMSMEINGNYATQIQINFLAINPSFIPKFNEDGLKHANAIGSNKINNYLDLNVIASLKKGSISLYDTPINIMKIFLNDVFANKIKYHYIDSQEGHKVKLTDVSKEFLSKNS